MAADAVVSAEHGSRVAQVTFAGSTVAHGPEVPRGSDPGPTDQTVASLLSDLCLDLLPAGKLGCDWGQPATRTNIVSVQQK